MTKDLLLDLQAPFRALVIQGLEYLHDKGFDYQPYFTLRDPVTQAKLWRQSRNSDVINATLAKLKLENCPYLVACIEAAGPQPTGKWATNAIPGLSWHQYGLAVDCVRMDQGETVWAEVDYSEYDQAAAKFGITSGLSFHDLDHWQSTPAPYPPDPPAMIDAKLRERWHGVAGMP